MNTSIRDLCLLSAALTNYFWAFS